MKDQPERMSKETEIKLLDRIETGDTDAYGELLTNLGNLIHSQANYFSRRTSLTKEQLLEDVDIPYSMALKSYDREKGMRFTSGFSGYYRTHIDTTIKREMARSDIFSNVSGSDIDNEAYTNRDLITHDEYPSHEEELPDFHDPVINIVAREKIKGTLLADILKDHNISREEYIGALYFLKGYYKNRMSTD